GLRLRRRARGDPRRTPRSLGERARGLRAGARGAHQRGRRRPAGPAAAPGHQPRGAARRRLRHAEGRARLLRPGPARGHPLPLGTGAEPLRAGPAGAAAGADRGGAGRGLPPRRRAAGPAAGEQRPDEEELTVLDLLDLTGTALHEAVRLVLIVTAWPTLAYFLAINLVSLALVVLGFVGTQRSAARRSVLDLAETATAPVSLGLTVVMPAYNESAVIIESVRSSLAL